MNFLDLIWLIPLFPLLGAALMLLFGKLLDPQPPSQVAVAEGVTPVHDHGHDGAHDHDHDHDHGHDHSHDHSHTHDHDHDHGHDAHGHHAAPATRTLIKLISPG